MKDKYFYKSPSCYVYSWGVMLFLTDILKIIELRTNFSHFRLLSLLEKGEASPSFWADIFQSLVSLVGIALPLLVIPPTILVATVRACLHGHCCQVKYKQSAGELLLVVLVTLFYLGSLVGSVLPHLDQKMDQFSVGLDPVPVLWELGNAAARPVIYFLANPAVWDGLKGACCSRKRR